MDLLLALRTNKSLQRAALECLIFVSLIILFYVDTVSDMVHLWLNSETYSHGLFILPLSAVLVYSRLKRDPIHKTSPQYLAAFGILFFGACWLISELAQINLFAQLSLVAILPFIVWALYGFRVLWRLKSALLFLFLAVPVGDFLIPHLQQITAVLSIAMIELVGIPVYSDGLYISIPAGNFLVAEACSGIRFLISSITIAIFYALLFIDNYKRRLVMVASGIFIPILANGVRVFMIIVIAHLSNMEAATGFDHIVYGWVFFSFVMIMLIWLGNVLADQQPIDSSTTHAQISSKSSTYKLGMAYVLVVAALSAAPLTEKLLMQAQPMLTVNELTKAQVNSINELYKKPTSRWAVYFPQADNIELKSWPTNQAVSTYKVIYITETNEKELITFENRLFNPDRWSIKSQTNKNIKIGNQEVEIQHIHLVNLAGQKRNILMTYKTDQFISASKWKIKAHQVLNKLRQTDFGGQALIMSAEQSKVSQEQLTALFGEFIQQEQ